MLKIKKEDLNIGQNFIVIKPLNCYKLINSLYIHSEEIVIHDIIVTTKTRVGSKSKLRFTDGENDFWCSWQDFKRSTIIYT
jgi:hypothetical protein